MLLDRFKVVLFTVALTLTSASWANEDARALGELLETHSAFAAQFQQYTLAEGSVRQELAAGRFWVEQPDRFRWETETPFPQLIVSDGTQVWIYDEDLEQVTKRSIAPGSGLTPAIVLGGDLEQIQASFDVRLLNGGDQGVLFELLPKPEIQVDFQRLKLLFSNDRLSELLIEDSLGQRSLILVENLEFDLPIGADLFTFEPPPGVDLIEDSSG